MCKPSIERVEELHQVFTNIDGRDDPETWMAVGAIIGELVGIAQGEARRADVLAEQNDHLRQVADLHLKVLLALHELSAKPQKKDNP